MHRLTIPALSLMFLTMGLMPAAQAADITLVINGTQGNGSKVFVQLCTQKEFLAKCALRTQAVAADKSVTVTIADVPPGTYAASVYQDLNGNGALDRGMFGIPAEPWAMSRDAKGNMGPPQFDDAKVDVSSQPQTLSMTMQ